MSRGNPKHKFAHPVGSRVGSWTILEQPPGTRWKCQCDCGYTAYVDYYPMMKGIAQSCYPCSALKRRRENNSAWRGVNGVAGKKWSRLNAGARSRGLEVSVSFEYVASLFTAECALSGLPIDKDTGSIDRIDSSKGYIEGNIQWVHKDVNMMKKSLPEHRFIELCEAIAKRSQM